MGLRGQDGSRMEYIGMDHEAKWLHVRVYSKRKEERCCLPRDSCTQSKQTPAVCAARPRGNAIRAPDFSRGF